MKRIACLLMLALSSACGLSHTVNDDVFSDMSVDKKLRLFEAENDISIAMDERDQMRDRIRDLRIAIREAEDEQGASDRDEDNDRKTAILAHNMWDKRLDYLDGSVDYLKARMDAQDSVVTLAQAKFELAKAYLIKRNKLAGADSIHIKDFEAQVARCGEAMHTQLAQVERGKAPLQRVRSEWLRLRDELAASHLNTLATPGDDELPVWEAW